MSGVHPGDAQATKKAEPRRQTVAECRAEAHLGFTGASIELRSQKISFGVRRRGPGGQAPDQDFVKCARRSLALTSRRDLRRECANG